MHVGLAEIARQSLAQPFQLTDGDGPVETEVAIEYVDLVLGSEWAQQLARDIAGRQLVEGEHQHRHDHERDGHVGELLEGVAQHEVPLHSRRIMACVLNAP